MLLAPYYKDLGNSTDKLTMILAYGLIIFILVITIHEFGHFFVGKLFGLKFSTFSVGMGPRIYKKRFGDTIYCLSILPIGGYVRSNAHNDGSDEKIPGFLIKVIEFLAPVSSEEKKLIEEFKKDLEKVEDKNPTAFLSYILGGCFFNFLSWILAAFLFSYFFKDFIFFNNPKAEISLLSEESQASKNGFKKGDIIIKVNNVITPFWVDVLATLKKSENDTNSFLVKRLVDNKIEIKNLNQIKGIKSGTLTFNEVSKYYMKYFEIKTFRYKLSIKDALMSAYYQSFGLTFSIIKSVFGLDDNFKNSKTLENHDFEEDTKKLDPLSSPVTAMMEYGYLASKSIENFYIMFVSITIGAIIINLLPIPGTDGFQVMVFILEKGFKINISADNKIRLSYIGLSFFLLFCCFTIFRDLIKVWL